MVAYSRRRETAEAFAERARCQGLEARSVADPRDAVADVDIVAFVFAGTGLADVALASVVFGRAVERGIGRILPR